MIKYKAKQRNDYHRNYIKDTRKASGVAVKVLFPHQGGGYKGVCLQSFIKVLIYFMWLSVTLLCFAVLKNCFLKYVENWQL